MNNRYQRRFTDPATWPSNEAPFADHAVEVTRKRINELSWALAGDNLADEIERALLAATAPRERRVRAGEPGE
jgi:hypothetical protein